MSVSAKQMHINLIMSVTQQATGNVGQAQKKSLLTMSMSDLAVLKEILAEALKHHCDRNPMAMTRVSLRGKA